MISTAEKTLDLMDVYLAAYLSLHEIAPTLKLKNTRVIFSFPATDEVYRLLAEYNSNLNIPVVDFTIAIKTLRSRMITMRSAA